MREAALANMYRAADPFPHIKVDGMFDADRLRAAAAEIAAIPIDPTKPFYGSFEKRNISDMDRLPPVTRGLVEEMNAAPFLAWLERVTGIENLQPDPGLVGGGIHQIGPGGFLKVHTDFNWHKGLEMHRRVNVLLYLNEGWDEAWGGALELWKPDMSECRARYAPLFNRLVVFSTTDESYHGHPDPLQCPPDVRRNSIALYYYTKERPADEVKFGQTTLTNYRPRTADRLGLKHKVHQAMLRLPGMKKLLGQ